MEQDNINKIEENIKKVKEDVYDAAVKASRQFEDITIIGVSKKFSSQYAKKAFLSGLENLGENRVDELLEKKKELEIQGFYPNWHMIGTLQRKKVKKIIGQTKLIHSVDSIDLLEEIEKQSKNNNIITDILLQVNLSKEESKHGFDENEIMRIMDKITNNDWIKIKGLMTMAPLTQDQKILNSVFINTATLYENIKNEFKLNNFKILSMGMSNDYKIAIAHGATHIRLGTVIFGERTY